MRKVLFKVAKNRTKQIYKNTRTHKITSLRHSKSPITCR